MATVRQPFIASFPSGVIQLKEPAHPETASPVMLHVGTGDWPPNVDAVLWFLVEMFPLIKKAVPGATFVAAGRNTPDSILERHNGCDIKIHGFVEDLSQLYADAAVFISPLRFGSGIKIKILDAMARGLPVVATSTALEGLPFVEADGVIGCDTISAFVRETERLLSDPGLRGELGQAARQAVSRIASVNRLDELFGNLTQQMSRQHSSGLPDENLGYVGRGEP